MNGDGVTNRLRRQGQVEVGAGKEERGAWRWVLRCFVVRSLWSLIVRPAY